MEAEINLSAANPCLVVQKDGSQIVIRCEEVEQTRNGPRKSGRYIHLGMTTADATQLLALLKDAEQRQALVGGHHRVMIVDVPPEKDRH